MKYILSLLVLVLLFISCETNKLDQKETKNEEIQITEKYSTLKETDIKQGPYERKDLNGELLEISNYDKGKLHGEQKLYEKGVIYSTANYDQGKITGKYQSYYPNGEVYVEGNYQNEMMDGKWKTYYETGKLKEVVYFKNNEENGPFVEFHTNGNLKAEGEYLDGDNEHGELLLYSPNGILIQKMNCDRGICRTTWKKDGNQGYPEDIRGITE